MEPDNPFDREPYRMDGFDVCDHLSPGDIIVRRAQTHDDTSTPFVFNVVDEVEGAHNPIIIRFTDGSASMIDPFGDGYVLCVPREAWYGAMEAVADAVRDACENDEKAE